ERVAGRALGHQLLAGLVALAGQAVPLPCVVSLASCRLSAQFLPPGVDGLDVRGAPICVPWSSSWRCGSQQHPRLSMLRVM
ncbi:hypothetical protein DMH01_42410, partial [Amycolatopsis sp. WAC 04182]